MIAMIFIVMSHVPQTLLSTSISADLAGEWSFNFVSATTNPQYLALTFFRYLGEVGNLIFVVCSSWFLLDKERSNKEKLLRMFFDVLCISMLFLLAVGLYKGFGNLSIKDIIKSAFPNFFCNNWFTSCYILFCLLSPFLNKSINNCDKRQLLTIAVGISVVVFIGSFINNPLAFDRLLVWIAIYFVLAFIKRCAPKLCEDTKTNVLLTAFGFAGITVAILLTNFLGLKISLFADKNDYWNTFRSPFCLMIGIGSFNLFRKTKFKSKFINYLSSTSILIYLFHENLLFRTYIRPLIWRWLYETYGYSHIALLDLVFTFALFASAIVVSIVYKETLQKLVHKGSDKLYSLLARACSGIVNKLGASIK